jgi:hypothetical protein
LTIVNFRRPRGRRDRVLGSDELRLRSMLREADRTVFRADGAGPLPLEGRKLHWQLNGSAGSPPSEPA